MRRRLPEAAAWTGLIGALELSDDLRQAREAITRAGRGTVGSGSEVFGGTVVRLIITFVAFGVPELLSSTQIGSGSGEQTNPAALVIGPAGAALGADALANRIAAIPDGTQAAVKTIDASNSGAGNLFGLAVK